MHLVFEKKVFRNSSGIFKRTDAVYFASYFVNQLTLTKLYLKLRRYIAVKSMFYSFSDQPVFPPVRLPVCHLSVYRFAITHHNFFYNGEVYILLIFYFTLMGRIVNHHPCNIRPRVDLLWCFDQVLAMIFFYFKHAFK